jgi:hypothetical protein
MKAVARLVYSYFTCTPAMRALTIGGLVLMLVSLYVVTTLPQSAHMLTFAFGGVIAVFLGSSFMPLMFGRLSRSHALRVLPHARIKLLLSAFITVAVVSSPAALLAPVAYVAGVSGKLSDLSADPKLLRYTIDFAVVIYTSVFIIACWLYLTMWFITSQRNMIGFVKGLMVILFLMLVPAREIQDLSARSLRNFQQIGTMWIVFGGGFLLWPRWKAMLARQRLAWLPNLGDRFRQGTAGKEIDLVLGAANPWILVAAQSVPIAIAARVDMLNASVWLFYLTIFSTVAGANAGQAAERSRPLWLRGDWSREQLFKEVERSLWRYNSFVLGALILLMVGIGSYAGLPVLLLATGLPLLMLGTALSTYLGLMITRGLGWIEALLGVGVMLALMTVAVFAAEAHADLAAIVVLEVSLAGLVWGLRARAVRRWTRIDWLLCRRERVLSARAAQ